MNIQDIRRENLRKWVEKFGVPSKEKSYFSQILGGSSFGERSARRLERDYKMGEGYLDQSREAERSIKISAHVAPPQDEALSYADEVIELLALYQAASKRGRTFILRSARTTEKSNDGLRWVRVGDKG